MLRLYDAALLPVEAISPLWARWSAAVHPERAAEWGERLGRGTPGIPPGGVWLHGASVGEAYVTTVLARGLRARRPGLPLAASCLTRTGRRMLPRPPAVDAAFFAPLDVRGAVARALAVLRPAVLALVETELWPTLTRGAAAAGARVVMVNARLAPERMRRYGLVARLYAPLLARMSWIGAQSAADAERLVQLGAPPDIVSVTGNVKVDLPAPEVGVAALRGRFGLAPDRPVVIAGSTARGEEPLVLRAWQTSRTHHPALFLVLAPRHPERADEVAGLARGAGLSLHRLSSKDDAAAGRADGLLVDTVGELRTLYALGAASFVGGSLVPSGGHNVLEPAAVGSPVLFGPHVDHVRDLAAALLAADAAVEVADAPALARAWCSLLEDRARRERMTSAAAAVLARGRGAVERTVEGVLSVLDAAGGRAP